MIIRIKTILGVLVVIIVIGVGLIGCAAGPNIPKENIPYNIPDNLKREIERLYSRRAQDRVCAAFNLGQMGTGAVPAIPFLIAMLDDYSMAGEGTSAVDFVKKTAAKALVKIGRPAVEPLIAALKNRRSEIRCEAAWELGEIKDPRAVEPLIALLKDGDSIVRRYTAPALGKIKDPRAVEALIAELKDENALIQEVFIDPSLKEHPYLLSYLTGLMGFNEAAKKALEEITGHNFSDTVEWQKWWEQNKEKFLKKKWKF